MSVSIDGAAAERTLPIVYAVMRAMSRCLRDMRAASTVRTGAPTTTPTA